LKDFRFLILATSAAIALIGSFFIYIFQLPVQVVLGFSLIFFSSLAVLWLVFKYFILRDLENVESTINQMQGDSVDDFPKRSTYKLRTTRNLDRSIKDVSAKMNEKIKEYKRTADFRKDFIANISHELKTPLFAAQGFVHTLIDGAVKDKNVRTRFLKKAAKSLDGLDMLVQDLLTLSQIEIGDIRMHLEYFDIHKMSKEIFDQLEVSAEKKQVKLSLISNSDPILVFADYKRIHQVMTNLIQNAIKYNNED
jgi:two-component system phosphate regulon sensor histidine kinase PhoR